MPHTIVKMNAGRTDAQKRALADAVTEAIRTSLGCGLDAISVAIEDVPKEAWTKEVYEPDVLGKPETIWKQPGYGHEGRPFSPAGRRTRCLRPAGRRPWS